MFSSDEILAASFKDARLMVQENLQCSQKWLLRGIVAIFERQTADEANQEIVRYRNGVGFGAADCEILSSFAKTILRRGCLSSKQLLVARKLMMKYAGQLVRIAHERAAV